MFENGQVLALGQVNTKQEKGIYVFPNPEEYEGLIAENNTKFTQTRDMLVAVLCPSSLNGLSAYAGIGTESTDKGDSRLFSYNSLLGDISTCDWTSRFLYIE